MTSPVSLDIAPATGPAFPAGVARLAYHSPVDNRADWALWKPGTRGRPTVVCLHGWGSDGDQLYVRADVRAHWLALFDAAGVGVLTPHLRGNVFMNAPAAADLHALLAAVRTRFRAGPFVFFSGSMGGSGNLIYAARHPEDVAAVAALGCVTDIADYYRWAREAPLPLARDIAGTIRDAYGGEPHEAPEAYAAHSVLAHADRLAMPVFLAHGASDPVIPVDQSRRLALRNPAFRYVEIAGGGHDAPLFIPEAAAFFREAVAALA